MNWVCRGCGTVLLVGVSPCSNCQQEDIATDQKEVEEIMAKAHRDRAATRFVSDPKTFDAFTLEEVTPPASGVVEVQAGDERPLEPAEGQDPNATQLPAEVDYDKWTVDQLKEELKKRQDAYATQEDEEGLEATSFTKEDKKADLIRLLTEDDEAQTEDGTEA